MTVKLTLSVDESIIDKAKDFATKNGRSLSSIVSEFLQAIVDKEKQDGAEMSTPIVARLAGILDLPENFDHKEAYGDHLSKKYG